MGKDCKSTLKTVSIVKHVTLRMSLKTLTGCRRRVGVVQRMTECNRLLPLVLTNIIDYYDLGAVSTNYS